MGGKDEKRTNMPTFIPRRDLLKWTTAAALAGLGDLGFLSRLNPVSAAEAKLPPKLVRFDPEIEPLVRLLEDTPRERLLEEVSARIHRGLSYRDLLAALLLAGVRNIQPRPVGFKFHAVLVINSAHLASLASPDQHRWLPIFWALDAFKVSQERNTQEGNWHMPAVDEAAVPPPHKARQAFIDAMNNWDESAADAAVVGLARSSPTHEIFELFCRYGCRDFRDIGHKAIYVANSWRTLQAIGWQHAEPVLRSLAFALLEHEGENPAKRDGAPDRPGRHTAEISRKLRPDWLEGKPSSEATAELLQLSRQGSSTDMADKVVELINKGVAVQSIWEALFNSAGELLMRNPAILSLHSLTASNALHYEFQHAASDETRRTLLLQNASFIPLFRAANQKDTTTQIDHLDPLAPTAAGPEAIQEILADIDKDRSIAARKVLGYLKQNPQPTELIDAARLLIFFKGRDNHDYKFSAAVMEDYRVLSQPWRDRYLAASVFYLKGSGSPDTDLAKRTRAALSA